MVETHEQVARTYRERTCKHCGLPFTPTGAVQEYCTRPECMATRPRRKKSRPGGGICRWCGDVIPGTTSRVLCGKPECIAKSNAAKAGDRGKGRPRRPPARAVPARAPATPSTLSDVQHELNMLTNRATEIGVRECCALLGDLCEECDERAYLCWENKELADMNAWLFGVQVIRQAHHVIASELHAGIKPLKLGAFEAWLWNPNKGTPRFPQNRVRDRIENVNTSGLMKPAARPVVKPAPLHNAPPPPPPEKTHTAMVAHADTPQEATP